jgi:hypothetical protein
MSHLYCDTGSGALKYVFVAPGVTADVGGCSAHVEAYHGVRAWRCHRVANHSARGAGQYGARPVEPAAKQSLQHGHHESSDYQCETPIYFKNGGGNSNLVRTMVI